MRPEKYAIVSRSLDCPGYMRRRSGWHVRLQEGAPLPCTLDRNAATATFCYRAEPTAAARDWMPQSIRKPHDSRSASDLPVLLVPFYLTDCHRACNARDMRR